MVVDELSTSFEMPAARIFAEREVKSRGRTWWEERGTMRTFVGEALGGKGEDVTGGRVGAGPVGVLDQEVEDAADAERGFDHVRGVFSDWVTFVRS